MNSRGSPRRREKLPPSWTRPHVGASTGAGATRTSNSPSRSSARPAPASARTSASSRPTWRRRCRSRRSSCRRRGSRRPASLAHICSSEPYARASHAYGRSYRDIVRAFRGRFDHPPDVVAYPGDEDELRRLLEWCEEERIAAIPYGGGTSVVGGVEADVGEGYSGALSIDLAPARPRAGDRHGLARRADPGRRHWARRSRTSCAAAASRCATSRSRSSTPRSAAGSPPGRAATSPRSTRTSTTWWSRCGRSRRAGSGRAGGCPARAPGRAPTGS